MPNNTHIQANNTTPKHGSFLQKELGGLPVWTWGLIIAGGVSAAFLFMKWNKSSQSNSSTASTASDNVDSQGVPATSSPDETNFGSTSVNGNQVPVLPPGYQPVFDNNGNLIGYEPTVTSSGNTNQNGGTGTTGSGTTSQTPGSTFLGPTGVNHYVSTGQETLTQIAAKFGLSSWNNLYAIPENQNMMGKMDAKTAAAYKPPAGMNVVLPSNINIAQQQQAGGSERTYTVNNVLGGY